MELIQFTHRAGNTEKTQVGKSEKTEVQVKICYRQAARYSGVSLYFCVLVTELVKNLLGLCFYH